MAEVADAIDLGSIVNRRAGSSPVIRTKIDSLLFGENLFLYGIPSAKVLWFCESKIVPIPIGTK